MNAFEVRKNIYKSIEILHTNPTPKQFIIYSLQRKCQHEITLTYSNEHVVRSNFDTTGNDFYRYATRSTEMWNVEADSF
jgi:hypothetical protein